MPKLQDNLQVFKIAILFFLGWFASLLIITYLGLSLFPTLDFYNKRLLPPGGNLEYFPKWSNWDGTGYRYIAEHGYTARLTVFFPLFPALIKTFTLFGLDSFWAAFLISQICTVVALFYFYKLIILDFDDKISKRALFALLVFPSSFYLMAIYPESLILALAVSAFYCARKQRWFPAAFLASLATLSKPSGIAVLFGIIIEYLYQNRRIFDFKLLWQSFAGRVSLYILICLIIFSGALTVFSRNQIVAGILASLVDILKWVFPAAVIIFLFDFLRSRISKLNLKRILSRNFLFLLLAFLPLNLYLYYQQVTFGSAFTFLKSELSWGRVLSVPWQAPLFNLRYIISHPFSPGEFSAHMYVQFTVFIIALICLIISYFKLRASYTAFFLISLGLPLFSGILSDITRYVLISFPMFLIFARVENEYIQKTGMILSSLMLALLAMLFFNSYFFI